MLEQALIVTGVAAMIAVLTTVAVAALVLHAVRRRVRAARARLRPVQLFAPRARGGVPVPSSIVSATLGSPGWWAVQTRRHRMWKAVSSAEHAVGVARRADVSVGDLPALTKQLRSAAERVDSVLSASARLGPLRAEDRADCDRIEAAAADIHAAALSSLRQASHSDTEPIASAVRIEAAALAAGVRAAYGRS